jgi:hypothetical protein
VVVVVAVDRSGRVVVSAGRVEAARLGRRKSSIGDWQSARGKMGMESHETPVFADGITRDAIQANASHGATILNLFFLYCTIKTLFFTLAISNSRKNIFEWR